MRSLRERSGDDRVTNKDIGGRGTLEGRQLGSGQQISQGWGDCAGGVGVVECEFSSTWPLNPLVAPHPPHTRSIETTLPSTSRDILSHP
eukprot:747129-Hanusia_phi.AAC.1